MERVAIIGNSGGVKSQLARRMAAHLGLPHYEVDALLWRPGWVLAPTEEYDAAHAALIGGERWVIDGLGWMPEIRALVAAAERRGAIVIRLASVEEIDAFAERL